MHCTKLRNKDRSRLRPSSCFFASFPTQCLPGNSKAGVLDPICASLRPGSRASVHPRGSAHLPVTEGNFLKQPTALKVEREQNVLEAHLPVNGGSAAHWHTPSGSQTHVERAFAPSNQMRTGKSGMVGGGPRETIAKFVIFGTDRLKTKKEEFPGVMETCCLGTPFPRSALFL